MDRRTYNQYRAVYEDFFNQVPLEQRPEAEAVYQAFKARLLCEMSLDPAWSACGANLVDAGPHDP